MRRVFTASCFIAFEGKVLLIEHKLLDTWLPVGGELLPNESPMQGAHREALEETQIEVEFHHHRKQPHGTPAGFIGYEEHSAGPKGEHMNFCFLGHATGYTKWNSAYGVNVTTLFEHGVVPVPVGDGSWSSYRWVTPGMTTGYDDLRMPPNVRDLLGIIAEILKG